MACVNGWFSCLRGGQKKEEEEEEEEDKKTRRCIQTFSPRINIAATALVSRITQGDIAQHTA